MFLIQFVRYCIDEVRRLEHIPEPQKKERTGLNLAPISPLSELLAVVVECECVYVWQTKQIAFKFFVPRGANVQYNLITV